ncbi:TniQ family protein [Pseudomonas sp. HLT2-19-2]
MVDAVKFLLSSFSDESLASLLSRYHVVSGGYSVTETILDLFGKKAFNLSSLSVDDVRGVLSRFGDKSIEVAQGLIYKNSMLPLYAAFVARNVRFLDGLVGGEELYSSKSISGEENKVWVCPECLEEDRNKYGVYLHRSHQIPGVYSCWRHGIRVFSACPDCSSGFLKRAEVLSVHIAGCDCGWRGSTLVEERDITGQLFSVFSREFMFANLAPIPNEVLVRAFNKAIGERVSGRGCGLDDINDYIYSNFDGGFLSKVLGGWRNPSARIIFPKNNVAAAPLSRKLLTGFCLFDTFETFLAAIQFEYERLSAHESNHGLRVGGRQRLYEELGL